MSVRVAPCQDIQGCPLFEGFLSFPDTPTHPVLPSQPAGLVTGAADKAWGRPGLCGTRMRWFTVPWGCQLAGVVVRKSSVPREPGTACLFSSPVCPAALFCAVLYFMRHSQHGGPLSRWRFVDNRHPIVPVLDGPPRP